MPSLERRYRETSSDEMKGYYEQFMSETPCPDCQGARLRPESLAVRVGGLNIDQLTRLAIAPIRKFLADLRLSDRHTQIAEQIRKELDARLGFLIDVGLDYLTLARASATLSGGEAQRIRLATQIGSKLMGVLYVLDEPSIGLHPRDNNKLLATLKGLRDQGNTVLVVEHDDETIRSADWVVDLGPGAGEHGGEVVAEGTPEQIEANPKSITGAYLSGRKFVPIPDSRREGNGKSVRIVGASGKTI